MKKKILTVTVLFVVFFSLFAFGASAEGSSKNAEEFWNDFISAAPEGSVESENMDDMLYGVGADNIFCQLWFALSEASGNVAAFFLMLVGLSFLLSAGEMLFDSESKLSSHVGQASSLVGGILIFSFLSPLVHTAAESINQMSDFFASLVPIFSGILAASGNISAASAGSVNMTLSLWGVSFVLDKLLLPLSFALFVLSLFSGFSDGHIAALSKGLKGFFTWGLGALGTIIIAASSLQSVISAASDSAYLRAAKYAASGMIPIVGGTVSAALSTLAGGLGMVKGAVGVGSVMVIVSLALSPLLTLLLYRLCLSLCLSFLEFSSSTAAIRLFSAFRSAMDAIIAVYSLSVTVYISQIIIFVKSGVEIFG